MARFTTDIPYLFAFGVLAVLLLLAITTYVMELRRAGSTPWSESHNDKLVPLYRRGSHANGARAGDTPTRADPRRSRSESGGGHPRRAA